MEPAGSPSLVLVVLVLVLVLAPSASGVRRLHCQRPLYLLLGAASEAHRFAQVLQLECLYTVQRLAVHDTVETVMQMHQCGGAYVVAGLAVVPPRSTTTATAANSGTPLGESQAVYLSDVWRLEEQLVICRWHQMLTLAQVLSRVGHFAGGRPLAEPGAGAGTANPPSALPGGGSAAAISGASRVDREALYELTEITISLLEVTPVLGVAAELPLLIQGEAMSLLSEEGSLYRLMPSLGRGGKGGGTEQPEGMTLMRVGSETAFGRASFPAGHVALARLACVWGCGGWGWGWGLLETASATGAQ